LPLNLIRNKQITIEEIWGNSDQKDIISVQRLLTEKINKCGITQRLLAFA
jgi:hypothetical protein